MCFIILQFETIMLYNYIYVASQQVKSPLKSCQILSSVHAYTNLK